MSVTPPVAHVEMWPYVASAPLRSSNHAVTASRMVLSSTMLLMVGCGVGPDVGAASVHIRSQSIINGYGTGTTATGRNYRRSTCVRLPRSSWRLGWAASRSAARGGAASGAGRDWAGSGGPLCACKERSGEASHTTKSVLDAPRRVARTGRRNGQPAWNASALGPARTPPTAGLRRGAAPERAYVEGRPQFAK